MLGLKKYILTSGQKEEHSRVGKYNVQKYGRMKHGIITGIYLGCLSHLIHVRLEGERIRDRLE